MKREYIDQSHFHKLINAGFIVAVKVLDNSTHSADRTVDTATGAAMFGTAGAIVGSALGDQQKGSITVLALCTSGQEYLCEYKPGSDDLLRGWEDNKKMLLPLFKEEWPKVAYNPSEQQRMTARLQEGKEKLAFFKTLGFIVILFFAFLFFSD